MKSDKDTLYARWLSGEIGEEELQSLQASGALEDLEAIIRATESMAMPGYDAEAAYQQFKKNKKPKQAKIFSLKMYWGLGLAASLAAAIAAIFWITAGDIITIKALHAENRSYTFSDGSSTVLNDGSSIMYDQNIWDKERALNLTGEAFFDVKKGKPFRVVTVNGTVEVLGTSFNVRAWEQRLLVECYSGRVRVKSGRQDTTLGPGQSVALLNDQVQNPPHVKGEKPSWMTGKSEFHGETVNEVFREMERQFGIKVVIFNDKNQAVYEPFNGSFKHDNVEEALEIICKAEGCKYDWKDKKTIEIKF